MLTIKVFTLEDTGYQCNNPDCQHLPEYHWNVIGSAYHMRTDKICAMISVGGQWEIYCNPCISHVYRMVKSKLDKSLWAFQ